MRSQIMKKKKLNIGKSGSHESPMEWKNEKRDVGIWKLDIGRSLSLMNPREEVNFAKQSIALTDQYTKVPEDKSWRVQFNNFGIK